MKIDSINDAKVKIVAPHTSASKVMRSLAKSEVQGDAFYVADVGNIVKKYETWRKTLPNVQPFYTMRCNDSPVVLKTLASFGSGFNCFSKIEISKLVEMGVEPERIMFGNATKIASHIKYAASRGVELLAFDSISELHKIKAHHPNPKLILRVALRAQSGDCEADFSVPRSLCEDLLEAAAELGLSVVGLGFHSEAGWDERAAFATALRSALALIQVAETFGHGISLVDIGGGLRADQLKKVSEDIASALEEESPRPPLTLIAEPGALFVSEAFSLALRVTGVRVRSEGGASYYVSEGVYGLAFGKVLAGKKTRPPKPVKGVSKAKEWECCDVVGPTCDSLDLVYEGGTLPRLKEGDWIAFPCVGAFYQSTSASCLGGVCDGGSVTYFIEETVWSRAKESLGWLGKAEAGEVGGGAAPTTCRRPSSQQVVSLEVAPLVD